jgi:hypothetical protein
LLGLDKPFSFVGVEPRASLKAPILELTSPEPFGSGFFRGEAVAARE